ENSSEPPTRGRGQVAEGRSRVFIGADAEHDGSAGVRLVGQPLQMRVQSLAVESARCVAVAGHLLERLRVLQGERTLQGEVELNRREDLSQDEGALTARK